ncbi:nucleotidyltransferase family protein [Rurimicrobium arvi]|uniref:Nucleotidyltransferase family protein n=1 Tax=Rurimicrobium arvi TaxID=2049916 RepID=A0ABP8MCF3_9BACT
MKAFLLSAGLGTRLKPFTDKHPKALAPVNGKPLLEHNIAYLRRFGITEVIVNVHHFADQIEASLQQNNGFGLKYRISDEREFVLETGGGLMHAAHFFSGEYFVMMNVDILTDFELPRLIRLAAERKSLAALAVMQRNSSRQLLFDDQMQLCGWKNRVSEELKLARRSEPLTEFAFSGIHVLHTDIFKHITRTGKFSIVDAYLDLAADHTICGLDHTGDLLLDVGKPESLEKAASLFS